MENNANLTEDSRIEILVTIDKRYLKPLATMLVSYGQCHKNVPTTVYIAHSELDDNDIDFLKKTIIHYDIELSPILITEKWFAGTPVLERLPQESFFRLMAFHYLPSTTNKCLYLDPDILIQKSLLPLYNMDIGDNYIAAASHMRGFVNIINKARLGIDEPERYINSGIMLMNISAIRRDFSIETILESLNKNIQKLLMGDQDLINILFGEKTVLIDECIYNLDERTYKRRSKELDDQTIKNNTAIIHYDGKYKPWLNGYKGYLNKFYPEQEEKGPAPKGKKKAQAKAIFNIIRCNKQQNILLLGTLSVIIFCLISYLIFGNEMIELVSDPEKFRSWLAGFGIFDEIVFIILRAAQTIVKFIPSGAVEIVSGYAYGAVLGVIYCLLGNILGSIAILSLTKRFGKKFAYIFLNSKNTKIQKFFQNGNKAYPLIFIIYLIPGTPKDGLTYVAGLMQIKTVPFLIITSIARIPSIFSSTFCGATLANKQFFISGIIFAVTIAITLAGLLIYKKYFSKKPYNKLHEVEQ